MIVAIIRIPRPAEAQAAAGLEARFAERLGFVQGAAGFAGFELLRPVEGADPRALYERAPVPVVADVMQTPDLPVLVFRLA